ncbi:ectopic P granules protein 5 homolog isoform X2 [Apis mellifera]|uniref:Ectopic P granules protein 5 homolog isoform X2 n=1 Tax=Apis mellifera TaxID=7460 RepID=A0A7M7MN61_APIME|nr:ectopic P granules protein 5 homolog isoform X2 [Apis mellifera]|eukprot:XP_026298515.1 ectopic P granules protein 5 homolog isoform X2 [Apis mellifera]
MEVPKQRKKKREEKSKFSMEQQIPDVPTLEEFECVLEESPTNYPKGEGVENMESELHSAAIDTELYEKQSVQIISEETEGLQTINDKTKINNEIGNNLTSAWNNLNEKVEEVITSISTIDLVDTLDGFNNGSITTNLSQDSNISNSKNFIYDRRTKNQSDSIINQVDDIHISFKEIIPFTESQLASLYFNQELAWIDMFISEFAEIQLRSNAIRQQHRLHELLMNYLRVRNNLIINSHELEILKKSCREMQKQLWCLDKACIRETGECQDGNPVVATHEYYIARFNQQTLAALTRNLSTIKDLLHNTQALYCYEAEMLKFQIEYYIQRVCISCKEFINLPHNAPVNLLPIHVPSQTIPQLVEIRMCITILFNFQRKLLKDGKFVTDTREWLTRLIAILLRVATWQDHLFILNHILRCPGGVMNWARSYVQTPISQQHGKLGISSLNDPYLDHIIATLAVILLPIKDREKFLEQVQQSLQDTICSPGDTVWVMLDEEGEEDEDIANVGANLFESDLISLLNQIPFSKIFEQVLCIQYQNDDYHQNKTYITHHHLFRMFAFFTTIIRLLKQGLKTYDSPRYRQLTKRLSALIKDIVQYANDQWEEFDKNQINDVSILKKLQLEFDCFFLRAVLCIFSSRRLGAWQYLASLPYDLISSNTLWQIFYILHTDCTQIDMHVSNRSTHDWINELNSSQLCTKFEEKLSSMPGDESYFLLTTFANMALARTEQDYDFVKTTTIDLFQIGFLSEKTQDSCSKDARSLLSNLTYKYPSLLSDILQKLRDNFVSAGKLSLYLFTDLKLYKWILQEKDIIILSTWLHQYSLTSTENHLARLILTHLNWGFDENDSLYLPIDLHRRIALLIVELTMKYVPDSSVQNTSLLVEGVKQMSTIIRPQNAEHIFSLWAWDMVSKLRLHQLDQTEALCHYALLNPTAAFAHVPDMDSDLSLEILVTGIREKQPIACYVATLMTLWGHSIPLICLKGFGQLEILQYHCKYEQMLICLHHIIPLFLECVDSLLKNDKFISLVISLIMADRSYMKVAKSLITPEFPGTILKQFSNMIHSHLYNYKKYHLQTPKEFVYLWLNTFIHIPDWNKDQSVLYLMDIVISAAFFHTDAKETVEHMFQNLFSNASNRNVITSFGSFLNWATGSSNSISLLGKSTQSVWVAHQILLTEQYNREIKTGLWHEILKELSAQPNISLDTAIKRACVTVKMQPFGINGLSIYRWSQQALDTPIGHPILPLLWQNFFALFLARVPTLSGVIDHGGIGEKFFEGMINLSYLKKLKKRLHDTTTYFQLKGEKDLDNGKPITDDKRSFYFNVAKFYKTLSLWLEEPRLHEPGLYLPALPPQYMSQKLVLLVQDNWTPWLEYIDYSAVQQNQMMAVQEWECACNRNQETYQKGKNVSTLLSEKIPPLQRIFKRLTTYEYSVSPPPLNCNQTIFNCIPKENIYNSNSVIDLVKPYLKIILDYAQTYNLMISEHTAVDSSFLELVPTLYKENENQVTLHALCDPAPPNQKHTRSGTPPTVHCAGPAVITVKVLEAHISDGIDHMITQNRAEYENLLIKASQPPPSKVTQGCLFIDHLIAMLEHEILINRTNENTTTLYKIQESGVKLFYHLINSYTEEVSLCPPTKQLITTCLEKLGQSFINGEESQGLQLLNTIMQKSNLGGLLGPYFTPVAGSASTFLQMYQTVVEFSTSTNVDLCFVLLSKFDVGIWLNYKRPRLSERSTFIDLISRALCNMGLNPEETKLILHELFRNHLRLILLHEFPEHYGEVLSVVLKSSESQNLSLDVWRDLLGTLSGKSKNAFLSNSKIRDNIRHYATEQKLLSRQEVHDTAILLSKHFMQERLQYGLYGLYPKYRIYNDPLSTFLGMIGHALVALTLQSDRGSLGDQLCEKIWPVLSEMYSPWITPYWTRNLKEPTAAWIQQLTDDRSVLLPWIIADGPYANKFVAIFVECIRFINDTLPASSKILCFVWQFYVTNFAHASIKDHILNVIHGNFLSLPWDRFYPCINDVELMVKVIDQYLPDSHLFLGSVFTCVHWPLWINDILATQPPTIVARMHVCLLNLLVKLSNEPNVRQTDKVIQLIMEAEKFSWHLLDAITYDHIINWHVMSCDSRVVLHVCNDQCHPIDIAIHNLLKVAAGYDSLMSHFHPTTLKKRQLYIRSSIKLLITCTTRYKSLVSTNPKIFNNTLSKMLDDMEAVIINTVSESQQIPEASLLITELLHAINQNGFLMEHLRVSWTMWLSKRTDSNPILMSILKVIGTTVTSPSIFGDLMEAALEAYFKFNAFEEFSPTWASVLTILQSIIPRQPPVESFLVSEGKLLALYFILLKRLPLCQDIREEGVLLINLVDWISAIRPTNINEEKLPLLWAKTCELAYRQCQYNENTRIAARALKSLARSLLTIADDGGQGWGILGAIGLKKNSNLSMRCKFLSRAIGVYCLAQLPESKSEHQMIRFTPHSPGVALSKISEPDIIEIRPNSEAIKGMQSLEGLVLNKQYVTLKGDIERSIKLIRDPANSLHNATIIIGILTTELYNQRYLHVLID